MKEIIVINGSGGVGKDTFVEFCSQECKVLNISSVDKVKEAANVLAGWNGEKTDKARKFLADLKQLGIEYNDAPFQYLLSKVEEFKQQDYELLFLHVREKEEIEKCKNFGAKLLLVTNKNVPMVTNNHADKDINDCVYDYEIKNDGTLKELQEKAKEFLKQF